MGNVFGTAGLSAIATIAFVVAAILTMIADSKLRGLSAYNTDDKLQAAHNDMLVGYICAWIATGITLLLMIGYIFKGFAAWLPEWVHMILLILAITASILALIFMGLAMRNVDNTPNDSGTQGYLLWGMILTGLGLVLLVFLGMWRITHWGSNTVKTEEVMEQQSPESYQSPYGYQQPGTTVVVGGMPPPPAAPARRPPQKMN